MIVYDRDAAGNPILSSQKPSGNFDTVVTHNFCDNTTWPAVDNSTWELVPAAGKKISVVKAEIQLEHDLVMAGKKVFLEYYIHHPQAGIVLASTITFNSIRSIFELCNEHSHCPPIANELPTGLTTAHFQYPNKLVLYGDPVDFGLAKIVARTENNEVIGGSYVTAGFVVEESDI